MYSSLINGNRVTIYYEYIGDAELPMDTISTDSVNSKMVEEIFAP